MFFNLSKYFLIYFVLDYEDDHLLYLYFASLLGFLGLQINSEFFIFIVSIFAFKVFDLLKIRLNILTNLIFAF